MVLAGLRKTLLAAVFAICGFVPALQSARADDGLILRRLALLHDTYYYYGVIEYCGLTSFEVFDGYERRVRYLLLTTGIDKATEREIRISGDAYADYQFDDHGLGGFRHWCLFEGQRAAREFVAFRNLELAEPLQ
jgi:hypothetical protein